MTDNRTSTEKAIQRTDDALSRCQMELTSAIENLRQATVQENYQKDDIKRILELKDQDIADLKAKLRVNIEFVRGWISKQQRTSAPADLRPLIAMIEKVKL